MTLLRHQIEYLEQRCSDGYSRSRWIREAIDARIAVEIEEARKVVQRAVVAHKRGSIDSNSTNLGVITPTQAETLGNFRASVQAKLATMLVHSDGEVPVPEEEEPEVR